MNWLPSRAYQWKPSVVFIAQFKRGDLLYEVAEGVYRCDRAALQAIAREAGG